MKDLATQSELATFCDCRVKHQLSYDQLLKPKQLHLPFHLGTVMHEWLASYYQGKPLSMVDINKQVLATSGECTAAVLEEIDVALGGMRALAEVYPTVDPVKKLGLTVKGVEQPWQSQDPNVPNRALTGRGDLYAVDKDKKLWVIDHKLMSRIDQRLMDSFVLNTQAQTYLLGARTDPTLRLYGLKLGGFIPNVLRKPALRRKDTEGEDNFIRRIAEDIKARPAEYFWHEQMVYQEDVSRRFEDVVFGIVKEMRNPQRFIYPNFSQCETVYGRCPFHGMCSNVPGHESMYVKKQTRHEELLARKAVAVSTVETAMAASPTTATASPVKQTPKRGLLKNIKWKKK